MFNNFSRPLRDGRRQGRAAAPARAGRHRCARELVQVRLALLLDLGVRLLNRVPSLASLVDCATRASRRCPRQRASASDDTSFATRSAPVADHSAERVARDVSWIVRSRSALPSTNSRVVLLSAAVLSKPVLSPRQHENPNARNARTHAHCRSALRRRTFVCCQRRSAVPSHKLEPRVRHCRRRRAARRAARSQQHRTTPANNTGSDKPSPSPALPNQPTNQPNNRTTDRQTKQQQQYPNNNREGNKRRSLCVALQV